MNDEKKTNETETNEAKGLSNEGLSDAVFHEEHGTITLRTPEGWLLCNLEDKAIKTLGDLVERVALNLKSHEEDRDI